MQLPGFVVSILEPIVGTFRATGSVFSLSSLLCALAIGAVVLAWRRHRRGRKFNPRALARMLFPRKLTRSATSGADLFYFFFNVLAFGLLLGWAIVSGNWINGHVIDALNAAFGARAPSTMPVFASQAIATLVLFLAYEFGYWLDHYSSHRFPVLWEFHKVHHTAELLTPLTVWRVHPVEMVKFANVLAICIALANGVTSWGLGEAAHPFVVDGKNILLVFFIHAYLHLQHSNIWIPFRGAWGRVFLSPAHHQIHHSTNPTHFNSNMGSCLSIFDTLFGTLYIPAREPERLTYGVEGEGAEAHAPSGLLVTPILRALAHLAPARPVADTAGKQAL